MNPEFWRPWRLHALAFVLACLVAAGAAGIAVWFERQAEHALRGEEARYAQVRSRARVLEEEAHALREYLPQYRRLVAQGVIGEERRTDWIAALHALGQQHALSEIRYDLGPREDYSPEFAGNSAPWRVQRSQMKLTLELARERDLPLLLDALAQARGEPVMVRECVLESREDAALRLTAACTLDWLTLAEPKAESD